MSPFDGAMRRPETYPVASKKRPKEKATRLGSTPSQIYETAERILACKRQLDEAEARQLRFLAKQLGGEITKQISRQRIEFIQEQRASFEAMLVKEPRRAADTFSELLALGFQGPVGGGKHALRDARLKRAVEHVYVWLRCEEATATGRTELFFHPDRKKYPKILGSPSPIENLRELATVRPVTNMAQLRAIANTATVKERRASGGHKRAAIAIVALASGVLESTVKRASGS